MSENLKKWKMLKVFIFFLTSFLLWILFSFVVANSVDEWLLKSSKKDLNQNFNTGSLNTVSSDLDLSEFWSVYNLVKDNYYWVDEVSKKDLVDWIIKWFVDSLWDKHTSFMKPSEKESFRKALLWDFEWIWAVVEKVSIWVKVERLIKGSPAKKAWIIAWDIIIKANDEKLEDLGLYDAVDKIKWPAWTSVLLTILRAWEVDLLEVNVVREKIKIPSVESKFFEEDNIWYISLNIFWDTTAVEFKKALDELREKNVNGLIIDLRDNSWWYLQQAIEILSNLVDNWKLVVETRYRDSLLNRQYFSINDGNIFDKKIVVLINGNSASASEIVSWALREHNKAILVWEKTYWKWSVQQPFDLTGWWLLKLTIAKWFTPNWKNIDKEWIDPDIKVEFKKEDYLFSECKNKWVCAEDMNEDDFELYDRQLEEAKNILKNFMGKESIQAVVVEEQKRLDEENVEEEEIEE